MLAQPSAVILVRVADEQRVRVEPSCGIARQFVPKLRGDVRRIVIGIVRSGPNIHIDQNVVTSLGLHESHVAVADGEERKVSVHSLVSARKRLTD